MVAGAVELERADPARGGRLRRELDRVTAALADLPVGPTVVGHGDLHTGNLLVHRGTASVLDFEFSGLQKRVNDIAVAVCQVDGDPRLGGAIVEGYGALTDEERRVVPLFVDAHLLSHATWVTFYWSMGAAQHSQRDALAELDETVDQLGTCGAWLPRRCLLTRRRQPVPQHALSQACEHDHRRAARGQPPPASTGSPVCGGLWRCPTSPSSTVASIPSSKRGAGIGSTLLRTSRWPSPVRSENSSRSSNG